MLRGKDPSSRDFCLRLGVAFSVRLGSWATAYLRSLKAQAGTAPNSGWIQRGSSSIT